MVVLTDIPILFPSVASLLSLCILHGEAANEVQTQIPSALDSGIVGFP